MDTLFYNKDTLYEDNTFENFLIQDAKDRNSIDIIEQITRWFLGTDCVYYDMVKEMETQMKSGEFLDNINEYDYFFKHLQERIADRTCVNPKYLIWLGEKEDILEKYCNNTESFVLAEYNVNNVAHVADDWDVYLFGFSRNLKPISTEVITPERLRPRSLR